MVYLIDDRFAQPEVSELLPRWWKVDSAYWIRFLTFW